MSKTLSFNPLIPLKMQVIPPQFPAKKTRTKSLSISARLQNQQQQQQLNLSVLRFTLGIPGLDESYLPRWIGYGFGSLLVLNHFVGSDSATTTPAQLSTEVLGLSLAAFSIFIPYLGKFLKGASPADQATIPEGTEQIFVMSQNISDTQKEDLAWATYILLRNTNTIAALISIQGELCARGYWNIPEKVSKANILDWFEGQIERIGLKNLKDTLYFPQSSDSVLWEMLPKGTRSLLVQPVLQVPKPGAIQMEKIEGFVLLASSMSYAYSDKDKAWIGALANKFGE
ncbi:protein COFACTOR ASSEMBLY OF COMPLEX C SUBUNIT B CCB2, chloroplastic isoform X2 [Alnus glutinosa]|uniref:protein COFACTOR ASSEMBLY OF COMPLEX C SUBUNIT B CCB2, chloroplastic isoform X2 n=1 Tax=Alnus glutinosa TaxID=3517 RepID=UPI002D79A432|nr:protein COFACTOR ASSEMBLY OF COMPLEX C SUBUNIT B CCB2, chloroplastic isoform X2 [Alnus glutinosa]